MSDAVPLPGILPPAPGVKLTPMIQQYLEQKRRHPDAILLYRLGDFYEMFFEDAEVASRLLDLTLTARNKGDEVPVPLCGVPHHSVQPYVQKLLEAGHKVAICEQLEDASVAKGIVERRVVRVITPGTILEEEGLEPREPSYLVALYGPGPRIGLGVVDLSTGELRGCETDGIEALREELARLRPKEVVVAAGSAAAELATGAGAKRVSPFGAERFRLESFDRWLAERHPESALDRWRERPLAAAALAGLLAYLTEQLSRVDGLRAPEAYDAASFLVIDETSRRNLELVETTRGETRGSLLWVVDRTRSPVGARLLRRWVLYPLVEPEAIGARLDAVEEFRESRALAEAIQETLEGIGDVERLAGRLAASAVGPRDLVRLRRSLERAGEIRERLVDARASLLTGARASIEPLPDLQELLARALADDPPATAKAGDLVRDGYSAEVDELRSLRRDGKSWIADLETRERQRTGIASLKVRYNKVFGYYLEVTKSNLKLVPADYQRKQTIAGGERYITAELKDYEARVLGAEERLRRAEAEIFDTLVTAAAERLPTIRATAEALGRIDVLAALAEVADRGRWVRPEIDRSRALEIVDGRHPVVEHVLPAGRFVPNDARLDPADAQVVVLTGPNMAGKSTYLRQNALLVLLAQIGSFVPAAQARIGVVDRIFTRVGASDDLAAGDSTFMVEMKETAHILAHLTPRSLVVLDEIGRGTSTFDGISIAWAVAEHLHDAPAAPKTLFATHFHELTELAASRPRVKNFCVAVKEWQGDVVFLRRIVPGPASQSYGIHVARLAGIPDGVVARAREILAGLEGGDRAHVGGAGADQLPLFAQSARESEVLDELATIDPLTLTPIEALQRLADLAARARAETKK